jgi:hypothetical protein
MSAQKAFENLVNLIAKKAKIDPKSAELQAIGLLLQDAEYLEAEQVDPSGDYLIIGEGINDSRRTPAKAFSEKSIFELIVTLQS